MVAYNSYLQDMFWTKYSVLRLTAKYFNKSRELDCVRHARVGGSQKEYRIGKTKGPVYIYMAYIYIYKYSFE